jgi:hypothetical protein
MRITKDQQRALHRKWQQAHDQQAEKGKRFMSYLAFRRTALPTIGCDGAIAVPWCGMWLAIERDGYTHS